MHASHILRDKGGEVFTVEPRFTLIDAARVLADKRVGAAVVVDETGKPVGVFSERDLARLIGQSGAPALEQSVSSVMSTDLVTASPAESIDGLMEIMTDRRVRHVIIMDDESMVGMVSIGDVVKRKIAAAEAEAESLKAYIEMA